eukprot:UN17743
MHGREISKTILTSIKQLPNKIKSKFLHKNRALLFLGANFDNFAFVWTNYD